MSSESLAAFRRNSGEDLRKLAEEHIQHDLNERDRDLLQVAASKFGTHAAVGSVIGLGIGAFLAFRLRQNRMRMFQAFRTAERPTHVKFANGREEVIPDITPYMRPTTLGDIATYTFFAGFGLFLGGETGLLTGSWSAKRAVNSDPESRARMETAFRRFRADVLRKEIEQLERGEKNILEA